MLTKIEALNYRCLRYVSQPLDRFHVLVGPNASGKTTFLDTVAFVGDVVSSGLDVAMEKRSPLLQDLLFAGTGNSFEIALEAQIPSELSARSQAATGADVVRYQLTIGERQETREVAILSESVRLRTSPEAFARQRSLFPEPLRPPETLALPSGRGVRTAVSKAESGDSFFYPEDKEAAKGGLLLFKLSPRKPALGSLPDDESRFPVSIWLKELLTTGVQSIVLDSLSMRKASPPGQGHRFRTDGTNLPWVVEWFRKSDAEAYGDWIAHLQTALPDLESIETVLREDDKHRYLVLHYKGGIHVPSWTASDGTLRLLALTLPAYLPELEGVFLIEEPENGIHPKAVDTLYQSLSNVYDAQVLMATHSPVILSAVDPEQVLCFSKDNAGAVDIVRGDLHPSLAEWQRETSLGVLFAAGVLG